MKNRIWNFPIVVGLFALALGAASCGRAKSDSKASELGAYGVEPETSAYEVQCVTQPPPAAPSGSSAVDPMSIPIPEPLPRVSVPIEVAECKAFGAEPPHFYHREMSAMTAVVDCNAKVVRFRTRDWQVAESSSISPLGNIDLNVMLITRLVSDADGTPNCWVRLLGHVTGVATCPGDPAAARLDFKVAWRVDETPPEVMEPAPAGQADLRNGKHCTLRPGNCLFSNSGSVGCGG